METDKIAQAIIKTYRKNGHVYICGNGGSASMASHLAGELVNKFLFDRSPLSAISLSADISVITSIANDYDYKQVFARQLEAHAVKGDLLITMSTSGNSPNIKAAQGTARDMGLNVVAFPTNEQLDMITPRTQEAHLKMVHDISEIVEREMNGN